MVCIADLGASRPPSNGRLLVDPRTGSCRDGLHPDRANENRGGESVVCYLLGLAEIRQLARVNTSLTKSTALRAVDG